MRSSLYLSSLLWAHTILQVRCWGPAKTIDTKTRQNIPLRPFPRIFPITPATSTVLFQQQINEEETQINTNSTRSLVATFAISSLSLASISAKLGLLPGPYSDDLIARDVGSAVLTAVLGYAFVMLNTWASDQGYVKPQDSRKLIHTFSAPLFILFWPLFSNTAGARVFAAIVPTINAIRLYLASTGSSEASLAKAVSRSGDSREALGGPFIYVCILAACILLFWRESPIGIVALSALAAGDGLADLLGRRYGKSNHWPGLPKKSVAGSVAFWVGSTLTAVGLLLWMEHWECLTLSYNGIDLILRVAVVSLVAAGFELLPLFDDNYSVPLAAAIMTTLLL